MHQQVFMKTKSGNGGGFSLGVALMMVNPEAMEDEARINGHDDVLIKGKRAHARRGRWPSFDPGVIGPLDPEKILLVKEFLREKRGADDDTVVCGEDCDRLSLLSTTDLAELRQLLCA